MSRQSSRQVVPRFALGLAIALGSIFTFNSIAVANPTSELRFALPPTDQCRITAVQNVNAMNLQTINEYQRVESRGIWPAQEPFWIDNNSRTLMLMVHGFISSPRDQAPVSQAISSNEWDRFAVLLDGFGSGPFIANTKGPSDWTNSILKSLSILAPCYDRIVLVGHSLGGGLIADLILHHPEISQTKTFLGKPIVGQILLAPYMRPLHPRLEIVTQWMNERGVTVLDLNLVRALEQLVPGGSIGLPLPRKRGTWESTPYVPLVAAQRLLGYADNFQLTNQMIAQGASHAVPMPTLLIQAEEDGLVDNTFAREFTTRAFQNVRTWIIPAGLDVHHFVHQPEDNVMFPQMIEQIRHFLRTL